MLIAVAANKFAPGFDGTGKDIPDAYEIVDLVAALERVYATDAHLVSYVVEGARYQPRINKTGLPYFAGRVVTTTFFCDVDNAAHAEWTPELHAEALRQYATLDILRTAGVYHTAHGRRIVQPLAEPIPVAQVEPYLRRWLLSLEKAGLVVDWACRDWTRHFRLPHVRRGGRQYRSPHVQIAGMTPIRVEPIADLELAEEPKRRTGPAPRISGPIAFSCEAPEHWKEVGVALAKVIRDTVSRQWHDMYLALAGALLSRKVPPEHLPELVFWIALSAGSSKPYSHMQSARDTARRYVDRLPVAGFSTLRRSWPGVAEALALLTASAAEARLRSQLSATAAPTMSVAETTQAMEDAIRHAPDGLTVLSAECGLGKTHAAIRVAIERAQKPYASATATGARAPLGSKTAISVDKNALAIQVARDIAQGGVAVRRVFGPLSVVGPAQCKFHDSARPLVEGGQPMQWELCEGRGFERCEFYEGCSARLGVEGPDDARITVGPHALLGELNATAGSTGLLVIDEPPALLESVVLTRADLDAARQRLSSFDGPYATAMTPALEAFATWLDLAELERPVLAKEVLREPQCQVGAATMDAARRAARLGADADAATCAANALPHERRSKAPPIQRADISIAKRSYKFAEQVGVASKVLGTIHHATTSSEPVTVRVEERGDQHVLIFTSARVEMSAALKREGSVVVMDANAEVHLPILEQVVGYAPRFHKSSAADGAPIQRTLLRCRSATRRGWIAHGRVVLDAGVISAVRSALRWAREEPATRTLGVITFRLLRVLLEAALRPDDASVEAEWRALHQPIQRLEEARAALGPMLQAWPGEIRFGHYGAVRGLNTMADVDALITIADPWPNLADVRNDIAFLAMETAWEARVEALCRAELEQAHGRLRAVHRTRSGRALHVGNVLPTGSGWSANVESRTMTGGRPPAMSALPLDELRALVDQCGGIRAAARALGWGVATMSRYYAGTMPVPPAVAVALRGLSPEAAA